MVLTDKGIDDYKYCHKIRLKNHFENIYKVNLVAIGLPDGIVMLDEKLNSDEYLLYANERKEELVPSTHFDIID